MEVGTHKSRGGFSLVEMLVVVAVIILLVALLMPAFSAADEKGSRMGCISQLRQCYIGYHQFTAENKFFTPQGYSGPTWTTGSWRERIEPYINERRILLCPAAPRQYAATGTYGVNAWIGQNAVSSEGASSSWYIIPNLSKSFCIGENEEGDWVVEPIQGTGGTRALWGQPGWFYPRHKGGAIAAYFDGHVEWVSVADAHANNSEWFAIK